MILTSIYATAEEKSTLKRLLIIHGALSSLQKKREQSIQLDMQKALLEWMTTRNRNTLGSS